MAKLTVIAKNESADGPLPFPDLEQRLRGLLSSGDDGVIAMVNAVLEQAILHRASDVHIEPWDDCVALRFRIDGLLHEAARLPREYHAKIVGRVKIVSRIITYQKDVPQDGRIDPEVTPCGKAMRVSTFPTVDGEKIVVRVLDADPALFSLDALGFRPELTGKLRDLISRPQGTLLLTGPASSGKTTTIYALLKEILTMRAGPAHVVTIEDPVEYRLGHVAQAQVNPHAGFTFEAALRAVLRQDPEVIMLGEIRDPETARTAIQAGLTGHLVISTIHSGTAAGVFTRLLDMGIEPYLIASSVTGILAQRLVRRICPQCREPYEPDPALCARYGVGSFSSDPSSSPVPRASLRQTVHAASPSARASYSEIDNESGAANALATLMRGAGCAACQGIGFLGRMAVGELLQVSDSIADLVLARSRTRVLHELAVHNGMAPLAVEAAQRVREGVTTVEELQRVLPTPEEREKTVASD